MHTLDDTIAAIATPLGEGGLSVIRVSGPAAIRVVGACFRPAGRSSKPLAEAATHTLHYGFIEQADRRVDEVMVALMRAPRTFTREDVVEISCHGGLLTTRAVLETVLRNGARLAEPGEFTKRAFLHGRIDLMQAEAVADLIHARTELAQRAANEQLAGKLSRRIEQLRASLMRVLAHVEAHIDFPDEDIQPDTHAQLLERLREACAFIDTLVRTAREGQILRRGVRAAIIGRPNAGKSSLLNQLLGHERAIVTPIAGTTRDTIEETASIRGLPVVCIDTAGLREATDPIEQEGIRRTHAAIDQAELVVHVIDASEPLHAIDSQYLMTLASKPRVVVRHKIDQPTRLEWPADLASGSIGVSSLTGDGLDALKDAMKERVWAGEIRADMLEVMINARHQDALRRGREGVQRSRDALERGLTLELVAVDLRIAVQAVGEIVGKTTTDDLLDSIFSQFCLGK